MRLDRERHQRAFPIQCNPFHLADLNAGDLYPGSCLQAGDRIKHRLNISLMAPNDLQLTELYRQIRQGRNANQDKDTDNELQFGILHGRCAS